MLYTLLFCFFFVFCVTLLKILSVSSSHIILQLKEMLTSPLFNLLEVNDLSDELGSLSAAIEVCYHRY